MAGPDEDRVCEVLRASGLHMKRGWVREAVRSGHGPSPEDRAYQLALHSDFREAAAGCLPAGVAHSNNRLVQGKFVLQVRLPHAEELACRSGPCCNVASLLLRRR